LDVALITSKAEIVERARNRRPEARVRSQD